jgi:excisionase family DNA binding protein
VTTRHLFAINADRTRRLPGSLDRSRSSADGLVHLHGMDATTHANDSTDRPQLTVIQQVLTLSELCTHLHVPAQTIYDLRSQGRGPRGFRVGRELRFRVSEVEAWFTRMERDDDRRHDVGRP